MLYQLVYISAATQEFTQEDLKELLARSRRNNARVGVTGMLLFHEGSFIQVLEGECQVVEELFARIGRDPRHGGSRVLSRREIEAREFGEWSMGFRSATADELEGFTPFLVEEEEAAAGRAGRSLSSFREGRWHLTSTD